MAAVDQPSKEDGRGLGLTIVRGVVDAHGGRLLFGPGRSGGVRVTIRLPVLSG
jgi:signal transduction histidine kinase